MEVQALWLALHVAEPVDNQNSNEADYPNYSRAIIAGLDWAFSGGAFVNEKAILISNPAKHYVRITHFTIGTAPAGPGHIRARGTLSVQIKPEDQHKDEVAFPPGAIRIMVQTMQ